MARELRLEGSTIPVWWPDKATVPEGGWKIRTDIPLMDNLYNLIKLQCCIWMNKYRIQADTREDMEDLEMQYWYATYKELLRRLRVGMYRRDMSLYLNVRSCAWSLFNRVYESWAKQIKLRALHIDLNEATPNTYGHPIQEFIGADTVSKLMTESDVNDAKNRSTLKKRRAKRLENATAKQLESTERARRAYRKGHVAKYMDDAWQSYLEDCFELGVAARMTEDEFYIKNFPDEYHYKAPKQPKTVDPVLEEQRKQRKREYDHERYENDKKDPVALEKRRKSSRESTKRIYARRKNDPEYMQHLRDIRNKSYHKNHSKSSSDSTSSGSTGIPSIE